MQLGAESRPSCLCLMQMGNNLKYWGDNEEVISKTLQLFLEMTMGCGSSKVSHTQRGARSSHRRRRTSHVTPNGDSASPCWCTALWL